ncbi:hypothetical protein GOBAR_AA33014 [Gossypium barbadense]|uniref:Uncharacterized protein n=1 Tax=Gossypium barbadense TaxID=3634 RepID=A0A2P5W993_GOSBA|nr:hypothetical protein GOBAR_AA33014 [Gossypium barbadense]
MKSLVLLIKRQECERGAAKRRKDKELVDENRESCTVELIEGDTAVSLMMIRASSKEKDQVDEVAAKISISQSSYHSKKKGDDDDEVEADTVVSVEKKVDFLGFSILSKHANYLKIIYQKEANKTQLKTEMKEVTQKIASSQKELELKEDGETELKKQFEAISEFSSNSSSPLSCIVD